MAQKTRSARFLRQRRFLTVLPLLVVPFLTLIFWALGGGKGASADATVKQQGFNMQLPGADLKDEKALDKLGYYDKASGDSERVKKETVPHDIADTGFMSIDVPDTSFMGYQKNLERKYGNGGYKGYPSYNDPNEAKVYRKLAELERSMGRSVNEGDMIEKSPTIPDGNPAATIGTGDVDRLEKMMGAMSGNDGTDPETEQLNGMLESILDIQNPERVQQRLKLASMKDKGQVFPVTASQTEGMVVTLLDTPSDSLPNNRNVHTGEGNRFYSLENTVQKNVGQNSVRAVTQETRTLVDGSIVKLRLTDEVFVSGQKIPKGTMVNGTAQLEGERLNIKVTGIRHGNSLFPVDLSVYDLDGLKGVYIPDAISRSTVKESADKSLQGIGIGSLDPSLGAQAASAGIEAAKGLLGKKIRLVKVTMKAGYHVLLQNEKQQQ